MKKALIAILASICTGFIGLLLAIWCAALSGNSGSVLGGVSICLMPVGLLVFLVGFFKKNNHSFGGISLRSYAGIFTEVSA